MSDKMTAGMLTRNQMAQVLREIEAVHHKLRPGAKCPYGAHAAELEAAARREAEQKPSEMTDVLLSLAKNTCGPEVYDKALKSLAEDYEREGPGSAAATDADDLVLRLRLRLADALAERDALKARVALLERLLRYLDRRGGLGLDIHNMITAALAEAPDAQ
jgi:hypothetical protein